MSSSCLPTTVDFLRNTYTTPSCFTPNFYSLVSPRMTSVTAQRKPETCPRLRGKFFPIATILSDGPITGKVALVFLRNSRLLCLLHVIWVEWHGFQRPNQTLQVCFSLPLIPANLGPKVLEVWTLPLETPSNHATCFNTVMFNTAVL